MKKTRTPFPEIIDFFQIIMVKCCLFPLPQSCLFSAAKKQIAGYITNYDTFNESGFVISEKMSCMYSAI